MNRANPQCLACTSYIERGPRRCKHVSPLYIKFRDDYCPCVECIVKMTCTNEFRHIASCNEERCDLFSKSISKLVRYIMDSYNIK